MQAITPPCINLRGFIRTKLIQLCLVSFKFYIKEVPLPDNCKFEKNNSRIVASLQPQHFLVQTNGYIISLQEVFHPCSFKQATITIYPRKKQYR